MGAHAHDRVARRNRPSSTEPCRIAAHYPHNERNLHYTQWVASLYSKGTDVADNDGFKLPGSSYEELLKIVHAWGTIGVNASNDAVARLAGVDNTTISRNNGFLESVGILQADGRKKSPTDLGNRFSRAIEHRHEDELIACWRQAVQSSRFLQDTISAVRIRHGMDDAALERHIGFNAGQPSNAKTRAGIRTVIQILDRSGALTLKGDKYVAGGTEVAQPRESAVETPGGAPTPRTAAGAAQVWSSSLLDSLAASPVVFSGDSMSLEVRINIEVSVTPSELPALGRALRELRAQLGEPLQEAGDDASSD